ncbi:hypothetical protein COV06_01355 [Candidatus Uhrbacteria bacterium CG10_big_fil_rev_8_21_14_0_10_50_16]|uniref:riboflavin kinase n=1 Tax=Candidatus Uhrbacteria bacterium CG10_big_fil_rev_8_21_14_0_10_50_16 TaxID=1975039 RepID=A0A2H0RNK3_9BACT|nr:MAG: hypothetical protein COV06_01355 [Candidatus Uhrbacteria bacterium CG10_big_fil_rev_8_21_14_0_10_50_16]
MKISGIVQKGQQRARDFGYPTANIHLDSYNKEPGTYAAHATVFGSTYPAAAYISKRHGAWMCEVHLFDVEMNLYGAEMTVDLLSHVSPIDPFESRQQMQKKIHKDMRDVRFFHNP